VRSAEKIPVIATAVAALALPFARFGQFMRLAIEPALITAGAQAGGGLLVAKTGRSEFYLLWWAVYGLVAIPFSVSWTCLAVRGGEAISKRRWFTFGARELKYLAVSLGMAFVLFGPAAVCFYVAFLMGWRPSVLVLASVIFVVGIAVGLRLGFALPAIALDTFGGFKLAWEQTRSTILRILGVGFLSNLPINCGQSILRQVEHETFGQLSAPIVAVVIATDILALFLSVAVAAGAVAFCYSYRSGSGSPVIEGRGAAAAQTALKPS